MEAEQQLPLPMREFVEELGAGFVKQFERKSAKRISEFRTRNQFHKLPTWFRLGLAVTGVSSLQRQYHESRDEKSHREWSIWKHFKPVTWTNVFRCFFVYFSTKLLVLCGLQYSYDFHKMAYENNKLAIVGQQQPGSEQQGSQSENSSLRELAHTIQLDRYLIEQIGNPWMEYSFLIEAVYLCIWWTTFMAFGLAQAYIVSGGALEVISLVAIMEDWRCEQKLEDRWILKELNNFVVSSRQFVRTKLRESLRIGQNSCELARTIDAQRTSIQAQQSHWLAVKQLKEMALEGQLQPLNRSPDWMRQVWKWFHIFGQCLLLYEIPGGLLTLFAVPIYFDATFKTSLRDLITTLETVLFVLIMMICGAFYLPLVFLTSVDYIHLIIELRKEVDQYILLNSVEFQHQIHYLELEKPTRNLYWAVDIAIRPARRNESHPPTTTTATTGAPQERAHVARMNAHLLLLLMHYKIFVGRLKGYQRVFGIVMMCIVLVVSVNSVIILSHISQAESLTSVALPFCALSLVAAELCLAPMCYMNSRCEQLHKSMFSLFAHLARVQHELVGNITATAAAGHCNLHLVELIKKELSKSEIRLDQFAASAFGLSTTYTNLLKFHFWFGLLIFWTLTSFNKGFSDAT